MSKITSSSMMRTAKSAMEGPKGPERKFRINLKLLVGVLLAIATVVAILRALTETAGLPWLLAIPPVPAVVGDFATILAPLLAVSVAIERFLETVFDWYEQSTRAVADVLSAPREALDWIGKEYQDAYQAASQAADALGVNAAPAALAALEKAEQRLADAEQRLRAWTSSPEYIAWKRALSIWTGLMAGLIVTILGDLGMLHTIGWPAPRLLDMFVTGLVIGAGPGPMHSIIGILQSGKETLDNVSKLAKAKSIRETMTQLQPTPGETPEA